MRNTVTDSSTHDKMERPPGAILKEAREARGLTLDDVANITRIGKTQLQALEEETVDHIVDSVYMRGFLRAYAAFLKLPQDEVLRPYVNNYTLGEKVDTDGRRGPDNGTFFSRRWPVIVTALVVIAAVSLVFVYFFPMERESNVQPGAFQQPAKTTPALTPPETPLKQTAQKNSPSAAAETEQHSAGEEADTSPAPSRGILLKMKVTEEGWLDLSVDDSVARHYELNPGDVIEWKADKTFVIDVGTRGTEGWGQWELIRSPSVRSFPLTRQG